jgi:parallel beta-helix repeat protein
MALLSNLKNYLATLVVFFLVLGTVFPASFLWDIPITKAATYTVTNTNDSGAGSLRQAIINAELNGGADTIEFDSGFSGTISTSSNLPAFTEQVTVDGTTANNVNPGGPDIVIDGTGETWCLSFTGGSGHIVKGITTVSCTRGLDFTSGVTGATIGGTGSRDDNVMIGSSAGIAITGSSNITALNNSTVNAAGANVIGIAITDSASNITIGDATGATQNLISNNTSHGISVVDSSTVSIIGNYIGVDATGNAAATNGGNGILVGAGNTGVTIGGTTANERNIISGNTSVGVAVGSDSTVIEGNYIGLGANGTSDLGNGSNGIAIASDSNTIGGSTSASRNVISGNDVNGIRINATSESANDNIIRMNYIGTNAAGDAAVANDEDGVLLSGGNIEDTLIGGEALGNVISGNAGDGIEIVGNASTGTLIYGNTIGLAADNTAALGNTETGLEIQGDSTLIGSGSSTDFRNIISSNGDDGIYIDSGDSCVILGNYIGLAADGITDRSNTGQGVQVANTGASNVVGGASTETKNLFGLASDAKAALYIKSDAGDYNMFRRNDIITSSGALVNRQGTANENVSGPTADAPDTSYASGTGMTSGDVINIYVDKVWTAITSVDADGTWEKAAYFNGTNMYVTVTTANDSTSSSSAAATIDADSTAPTAPIMTSSTADTATAAYTMVGTKEANTNVLDGVTEIIANSGGTAWSYPATLIEGINTFSLTSKDWSTNQSTANEYSITLDTVNPTAPTLSYSSLVSGTSTTISGSGTEASANVYLATGSNGSFSDTSVDVDSEGAFAITVSLTEGDETIFRIKIVDDAANASDAAIARIVSQSSGGAGGGSSSSGSSSSSNTSSNTEADADESLADDKDGQSIAGEEENGTTEDADAVKTDTKDADTVKTGTEIKTDTKETAPPIDTIESIETKSVEIKDKELPPPPKAVEYMKSVGIFDDFIKQVKNGGTDSDGDGITDREEVTRGLDPENTDGDGDGTDDAAEIEAGTDPTSWDSDKDGIEDSVDSEPTTYNAPYAPAPGQIHGYVTSNNLETTIEEIGVNDTDGDGISDLQEFELGTDPNNADSDGDGLKDGDEVNVYSTNPAQQTSSDQVTDLQITSLSKEEILPKGPQVVSGRANPNTEIRIYKIDESGNQILVAVTKTDKQGKYNVLTDPLETGEHSLIAVSGDEDDIEDISQAFTVSVIEDTGVETAKPIAPATIAEEKIVVTEGANLAEKQPVLKIAPPANHKLVVTWQSTVYSQTLISDTNGAPIDIRPPEKLKAGNHTVTYYSVDRETNTKSAPAQISFNVSGTTAFATGDIGGMPVWGVAGGSLAVLLSLTALAVFFRKRRHA